MTQPKIDDTALELFNGLEADDPRRSEWLGMPDYTQQDNGPYRQLQVNFLCQQDLEKFLQLLNISITKKTKSVWYPERDRNNLQDFIWIGEKE